MKTVLLAAAAAAAMTVAATPATAQTTVLDFSGNICGAAGNQGCSSGVQIGQNYGDSANIDVSYRSANNSGTTLEPFLKYWSANYGNLTDVVYGGGDPTSSFSEITFTAATGFEVSLTGFLGACYLNRSSCQTFPFQVSQLGGALITSGSITPPANGSSMVTTNTGYFSGIVLRWGPDGYDGGLDNITFDVRAIGAPGAIPEPATWGMMIAGFGAVGGALRRRARNAIALQAA